MLRVGRGRRFSRVELAVFALALIGLGLVPFVSSPNLLTILILANIWAVFAMSWDILSGYTGQISFGHSLFIGLGGYTSALLSMPDYLGGLGWPIPLAMLCGGLVAALGGLAVAVPALRLHGPYLSLVTLIASLVADRVARLLKLETTGAEGALFGVPSLSFDYTQQYYYSLILMVGVAALLLAVARSRWGKTFEALRENEAATEAAGLNTAKYKILAFLFSGFTAGLGGAFYAQYLMIVSPRSHFDLELSVEALVAAVLGGMGTIAGPVVGAYFFILIREQLRFLGTLRFLVLFALALLALYALPRGFLTEMRERLALRLRLNRWRHVP